MPFANTAPLRREIEARLPERPFTVEFWDGTRLAVDHRRAARPSPSARRAPPPTCCARPGQLGLGRAYVSGELEVDDIDAVIALLDSWQPPALDGADKRALLLGAVRAAGPDAAAAAARRPSCARAAAATARSATPAPCATTTTSPTSSSSSSSARRWSTAARSSRAGAKTLEEAQEEKLDTVARKLELKEGERVLDVGCGWGGFPLWAATKYGASVVGITLSPPQAEKARRRAEEAGRRRPGRDPGDGLPRPRRDRRDVRRDRQHRHGRARRLGQHRRLRAAPWPGCSSRAGGCSTTASPACATPTPRPAPSPSATSSPTPRRCTSRATCWRWNGPASSPTTSRTSPPTTPRRCATGPSNLDENLEEAMRLAGAGTDPRLAPLPARRPQRLRIGLHLHLPGPLHAGLSGVPGFDSLQASGTPECDVRPGSRR